MGIIKQFLEYNKNTRVIIDVVGDTAIDEYYEVSADRISPEFPIPVYLSSLIGPTTTAPGMAANVAYQLKYFNVETCLYGFLDRNAQKNCARHGVIFAHSGLIRLTPIKRRLYHGDFPLCRWDVEKPKYGATPKMRKKCQDLLYMDYLYRIGLRDGNDNPHVTILSDYNKGFWDNHSCELWLSDSNRITIVDPKNGPAYRWRGCTVFKPNYKEAQEMSGSDDPREQVKLLLDETDAKFVVITLGGDGVVAGSSSQGYFEYKPGCSSKANSVIGAGDCFAAIFALAYAHGMDIRACMEVAFEAGAAYVQNKHNKPIKNYDLARREGTIGKIVDPKILKKRDYKLCFTNGCFDFGLTQGHIQYLQEAKKLCDRLVVAINSDASVARLKGVGRPIMSLAERQYLVAALDCVDYVVSFDQDTPLELIKDIMPNLIVKGGDYKVKEVAGYGVCKVKILPKFESLSTTDKVNKL